MPVPKLRKTGRITPDAPLPLLIAAFGRFLAASDAAPTTAKNYTGDLARFTRWLDHSSGQPSTLESVTPTDLRLYKQALIEEAGWKPASINRTLAALGRFFGWAEEAGLFAGDRPPKLPKAERVERAGPRWLSRREQLALARSVERFGSPRDQAVVTLLLHTGLRVAELCDLTWADVTCSPRQGSLRVRRGKGGRARTIPLNATARAALATLGYAKHAGQSERILAGQRGPLTPRGVQARFERYRGWTDLASLSPHTCRHTFCKNLLDAGVSLEKVAALAGHESLDVTRRYGEPSLADLAAAVERIGDEA